MGLLSLITGMIAVCISWVPHLGWGAVLLGVVSMGTGLLLVTSRDAKELHWQYGTFGIVLSLIGVAHALAYGLKSGVLQFTETLFAETLFTETLLSLDWPLGVAALAGCAVVVAGSVLYGRFKNRVLGCIVAGLGLLVSCLLGTSILLTADKAFFAIVQISQ